MHAIKPSTHRPIAMVLKALGVVIVTALIAGCGTTSALKAQTPEVLARIGGLIFTDAQTHAELTLPRIGTVTPPLPAFPPGQPTPICLLGLTQEEASELAGFGVQVPRDVPEPDWEAIYRPAWGQLKRVSWQIYQIPGGIEVRCDCFRFHSVVIQQLSMGQSRTQEFPISSAEATVVEVLGLEGIWIEDAPTGIIGGGGSAWSLTDEDIDWQLAFTNILAWEEDGISYVIIGDDELTFDDLLLVAEALEE